MNPFYSLLIGAVAPQITSAVRSVIVAGATALATKGFLTSGADVSTITESGVALLGVVFHILGNTPAAIAAKASAHDMKVVAPFEIARVKLKDDPNVVSAPRELIDAARGNTQPSI